MRGEILFKILEIIGDLTINTADLIEAFLEAGYGASSGQIEYRFLKKQQEKSGRLLQKEFERQKRQKYYNLIYKLKSDNLIEEKIKDDKKFFALTKKGIKKLHFLKEKQKKKLPDINYQKENDNKFIIIIFDVLEKERQKREWLRSALKNLGLQMLQKSVWVGKIKIPKIFIDDLSKINLIDFVEIFEITKTGSLKHLL